MSSSILEQIICILQISRVVPDSDNSKKNFLGRIFLTSISGRALSAENKVMVFPEPGGPQRTRGLCSANQV